jgi:mannosyl-3-phosphoglycerate phosphatase
MGKLKLIVFSDLDGTLLDHCTYQFDAAKATLERLRTINVPVILNTSKTFAEVKEIHSALKLDTPFIIENGAAIYIPKGTFKQQPADTKRVGDYWVKSFCVQRQHWLDLLSRKAAQYAPHYRGFSQLSDSTLSLLTGLTLQQATRAKQRQYGEPIQWLGDELTKTQFIQHLTKLGATVVQGGRFIHVGGYCDKGQALSWLTKKYQQSLTNEHLKTDHLNNDRLKNDAHNNGSILTVALGDGENDNSMLEVANVAVQVRSPAHDFPSLHRQSKIIQTLQYGPEGWAQAMQQILSAHPQQN